MREPTLVEQKLISNEMQIIWMPFERDGHDERKTCAHLRGFKQFLPFRQTYAGVSKMGTVTMRPEWIQAVCDLPRDLSGFEHSLPFYEI